MSFSGEIKDELAGQISKKRECRVAELAAIAQLCGQFEVEADGWRKLVIHTENESVARKCFTLLQKTYNIRDDVFANLSVRTNIQTGSNIYYLLAEGNRLKELQECPVNEANCMRAYLRGAFLTAGSVSDPSKSYHFEIVCGKEETAAYLQELMAQFEIEAKIVNRKKNYVVYLKEGTAIVDVLNVIGAHRALMKLENVRVLKEISNTVNRRVNCETANINKTVSAAVKQTKDIEYIRDSIGFDGLADGLKDVALTRLTYPEATLKELGELLETPIGKSGVNHRLRKLSELAEKLRVNQEENHDKETYRS